MVNQAVKRERRDLRETVSCGKTEWGEAHGVT